MTLRLLLRVLLSTWLLLIPLPWCLPSLGLMLVWLLALAFYALAIVIPAAIDADHIDHRILPAELPWDRGPPEPSKRPRMPPLRLVGISEKRGPPSSPPPDPTPPPPRRAA